MRCLAFLVIWFTALDPEGGSLRELPGPAGIVVNEIMYAPSSPEPEWIELLNRGIEPVNLKKWQICDATASRHLLPALDVIVPAGGFLLLAKDSTALHDVRGALPCAVINVAGFPSLNNTGDAVVLYDALGRMMDSVVYRPEWGGSDGGRSLERRDADAPSTEQRTWGGCTSPGGATPGQPNSIRRRSCDLSVAALFLPAATSDTLLVTVHNTGKLSASGYAILVYDDVDLDSLVAQGELVQRRSPELALLPDDSICVPFALTLPPGFHQLIAVTEFAADERPEDNQAICAGMRAFPAGALLINEIMAEPAPGSSEYVELLNASAHTVDLKGWGITDASGSIAQISTLARPVHSGEFLVIAADSSFFKQFTALAGDEPSRVIVLRSGRLSLNNDGDAVAIRDVLGSTIDSVMYSASWHNPDLSDPAAHSLERISPGISSNDRRNWGTCVNSSGGTPGLRNSISLGALPVASRLSVAPNPFSPDGDGTDDVVVIHYEMPLQTSIINVKIYDIRGRLVRRLASNEPGGAVGDIIWDGRDEAGAVARIGIYIALLEAANSNGAVQSARGVLVLARRL